MRRIGKYKLFNYKKGKSILIANSQSMEAMEISKEKFEKWLGKIVKKEIGRRKGDGRQTFSRR